MKHFSCAIFCSLLIILFSCNGNKQTDAPFITNDAELLDEYADKALKEAEQKVDSLIQTPLLDTSYFNSPQ